MNTCNVVRNGNGFFFLFLVAKKYEVISSVLMHALPVMPNLLALSKGADGVRNARNDWSKMDFILFLFRDSCKHDYDCVDITQGLVCGLHNGPWSVLFLFVRFWRIRIRSPFTALYLLW